jgi:putative ATPase
LDIFQDQAKRAEEVTKPLAERMRPVKLHEFIGQEHLVGKGTLLQRAMENDQVFSMIFWGPPGCGKTTLARMIAGQTKSYFIHFSAVLAGVKEIRAVIEEARDQQKFHGRKTILFVDEIHRFNKSQQDAFLHHVESGLITLIGATTENPSFEVIAPLLSRCRVILLKQLTDDNIQKILNRAINDLSNGLGKLNMDVAHDALAYLAAISDGDARVALNNLEAIAVWIQKNEHEVKSDTREKQAEKITLNDVETVLEKKAMLYDKNGEQHYNLISAFHKSLRGSDPDAALYWLARMLAAGEDPFYLARRMVRFASEDIGNADPHALTMAINAMESYRFLGSPEGDLSLAHAAAYLAVAPKSNSVYTAYKKAVDIARKSGSLPVPMHIRNAPTKLMKDLGYSKNYKYAHDFEGGYVVQQYLPEKLRGTIMYLPTERGYEKTIKQRLDKWRDIKKNRPNKE